MASITTFVPSFWHENKSPINPTKAKYIIDFLLIVQFFKGLVEKERKIVDCKNIISNLQIHIDNDKYTVSNKEFRELISEGLSLLIENLNDESDRHQ